MRYPRFTIFLFGLILFLLFIITHAHAQGWAGSTQMQANPYHMQEHPQVIVECCRSITVAQGDGTMIDLHIDEPSLGDAARKNREKPKATPSYTMEGNGDEVTIQRNNK